MSEPCCVHLPRPIGEFWASPAARAGMLLRRIGREEQAYQDMVKQRLRPWRPRTGYVPARPAAQLERLARDWRQPPFNRIYISVKPERGSLRLGDWRLTVAETIFPRWSTSGPCLQMVRRGIAIGPGVFTEDDRAFAFYVSAHAVEQFFLRSGEPTDLTVLSGIHAIWQHLAEGLVRAGEFSVDDVRGRWRCEFAATAIYVRTFVRNKPR
jgi:hypothetical protein